MLLQVVADTRDVGRDFLTVGEANAGHLAERRVRLLRSNRLHLGADAAALRIPRDLKVARRKIGMPRLGPRQDDAERRRLDLFPGPRTALAHQLIDCRHSYSLKEAQIARRPGHTENRPYPFWQGRTTGVYQGTLRQSTSDGFFQGAYVPLA